MTTLEGVNGTTCNAQQYQQSLSSLTSPDPFLTCLTRGQSIGLALTVEASLISFSCVLVIYILIGRNILRHRRALQRGDLKLLRVPADIYMLSLFIFDTIQAIGGILNLRWVQDGQVIIGPYCTAQGIIKQTSSVGTALITLILAVHTFIAALWGIGINARGVAFSLVGLTCVFIALWVGIGNGIHKNYDAPSPYWCWISPRFAAEGLAGEYLWVWIASFAVVIYIPLYLWAEGRLSIGNKWYKFHLSHPDPRVRYAQRRTRLGMLCYPLVYSLLVLPISGARWSQYSHKSTPSAAFFFGQTTFNLSGTVNVLLFLIIRPQLLLFASPEKPSELEAEISQSNTGLVTHPDTAQRERSLETRGLGPVDDTETRSWNFTFEGSRTNGAASRVSSTQGSDDI